MNPTIAVFNSNNPDRRTRVSLKAGSGGGLQLSDESFSPDVGWFTQSSIDLAPEQVAALRALLGSPSAACQDNACQMKARDARQTSRVELSIYRAG